MKITGLTTKLVEFPYSRPMGLAPGFELRTGGCVVVVLASNQGPVGEGLAYTFNAQHIKLINDMVTSLAPLVVGLDPRQSGSFLTRATADVRNIGTSGLATVGISAIDQALLDLRAKRQSARAKGGAGRQMARLEIGEINFVEVFPFGHVGEHHCAFEHVVEGQAVRFEHCADILHGLPSLGLDPAGDYLARARRVAECAGEIEDVADLHCLAERQFCRRRIG